MNLKYTLSTTYCTSTHSPTNKAWNTNTHCLLHNKQVQNTLSGVDQHTHYKTNNVSAASFEWDQFEHTRRSTSYSIPVSVHLLCDLLPAGEPGGMVVLMDARVFRPSLSLKWEGTVRVKPFSWSLLSST